MITQAMPHFLCDEMLGRFARYLRAAGYDTTLASGGMADRDLLALAAHEHRLFLTCDRGIAEHKAARERAIVLPRASLDDLARELTRIAHVRWLRAPFTRCLVDNTPLEAVASHHRERVPHDVAMADARFCPGCGRVYWAGSHHRRMQRRLEAWAAGRFGEAS
ncbi:MAG TPA: Mut7-C RNAse domain-containing protein [Casimicrobiaceae bacterium]|nr:Mut7-C RNAse domain-containing protein [Casimicrobiaceae bacterium]